MTNPTKYSNQLLKTISFILALFMAETSFHAAAQTAPLKQWDAVFGGSISDYLTSLEKTADGGFILGGQSFSGISGDKTQASQGGGDYWMVKTDAGGFKLWDATFGGSQEDVLHSIQQTADGGYILGGSSTSGISGDKTQAKQGKDDYWMVKTDAAGIKQWDATFGGSSNDLLLSLEQTADGGYILGGFSSSGISGDKSQASQGGADYWIVKTDANGVKLWDASFGGNKGENLYYLQLTADGGFILGGYSESGISGDKTQASQGGQDYWIVKTDANGVKQWDATFGGNSEDALFSLGQTADGGYILGGYSLSGISGDKTQSSQGSNDYWIVKTDASGVKQWDAAFGGSSYDVLQALQQIADGGYILGGFSASGISGDKTQASNGLADYWIVKTDASGVKQWDVTLGGSQDETLGSLHQTADGGFILGGYSSSGISGDKSQASQGGSDYWLVKMAPEACLIPTALSSIHITASSEGLSWDEVSGAAGYKVRYKVAGSPEWTTIQSTDNNKKLNGLMSDTEYVWQVKSICGMQPIVSSGWSEKEFFTTGSLRAGEESSILILLEVSPNPLTSSTTLSFSVAESANARIELFDLAGRKITTLLDQSIPAGATEIILHKDNLPGGIYLLQLLVNGSATTEKLVIQ